MIKSGGTGDFYRTLAHRQPNTANDVCGITATDCEPNRRIARGFNGFLKRCNGIPPSPLAYARSLADFPFASLTGIPASLLPSYPVFRGPYSQFLESVIDWGEFVRKRDGSYRWLGFA